VYYDKVHFIKCIKSTVAIDKIAINCAGRSIGSGQSEQELELFQRWVKYASLDRLMITKTPVVWPSFSIVHHQCHCQFLYFALNYFEQVNS
jgi:hypothetical protein